MMEDDWFVSDIGGFPDIGGHPKFQGFFRFV